jgi:hypothetical protein
MKRCILLLAGLFICLAGFAENFSLEGTLGGTFQYNQFNPNSPLFIPGSKDYALDNSLLLSTGIYLEAVKAAVGCINFDVKLSESFLSSTNGVVQTFDPRLNEAYISVTPADWLIFNLGKERIKWGTAFFYNPSDFINPPKDPVDNTEEKRGVYLAKATILTNWFSLSQIVVMYDDLASFGYGTKLSSSALVPQTDLNLVFYYSRNALVNLGFSFETTPFVDIPVLADLAFMGEAGFAERSGRKIADESGLSVQQRPDRADFYKNISAGVRYTIPELNTTLIAEYLYLDDGYSHAEITKLVDNALILVNQLPIEPGRMSRHTLFISVYQPQFSSRFNPFTDTLSFTGTFFINLEDASFFVSGTLESGFIENVAISILAGAFVGGDKTEYNLSFVKYYLGFKIVLGF